MKTVAVYPGSFDPITLGHVDVVRRMAPLFTRFIILVAYSPEKTYMGTPNERVEWIRSCFPDLPALEVAHDEGLTVDFARRVGASVIIRGIRGVGDMEFETAMARVNKNLAPDIETLIALTGPQFSHISSRLVKEIARAGGDLHSLVPPTVVPALERKFHRPSQ